MSLSLSREGGPLGREAGVGEAAWEVGWRVQGAWG